MVVACGALAFAACAPAVRSDRDESIPVPRGATWAWETAPMPRSPYEPPAPDTTDEGRQRPRGMGPRYGMGGEARNIPFDDAIFSQRFRRAAETAMQAKGFHKADDPSQAEFLLGFDLSGALMRRGGTFVGVGGGWGGPYGMYPPPYRGNPRDIRLLVMLRQRERGDVAWRASYIMDIYDMRESSQSSVQKIANKVLRELR
ncbi:MAG: DUF4136 domain-containing protein [Gemmatimonadales bacterium]